MADSDFEANNEAYLKAGLAWLHACLKPAVAAPAQSPAQPGDPEPKFAGLWPLNRRKGQPQTLLLENPTASTPTTVAEARAAFDAAARSTPRPALVGLGRRFRLSPFEIDLLWLLAALEIDAGLPELLTAAWSSGAPTFGLAMSLSSEQTWEALSPHRPLRASHLIEIHQAGATPLLNAPLRIDERIAAYVKGLNYLDERLAALCTTLPVPDTLPPSQQDAVEAVTRWLQQSARGGPLQLTGRDEASKRDVASVAADAARRLLLVVAMDDIPTAPDEAERFARLCDREDALLPIVILVECPTGGEDAGAPADLRRHRLLQQLAVPVLLACRESSAGLSRSVVVPVASPTVAERESSWLAAFHVDATEPDGMTADAIADRQGALASIRRLATEFELSKTRVDTLATTARSVASGLPQAVSMAWDACLADTSRALDGLAQRIGSNATIHDVELPEREKVQLQRLVDHALHRNAAIGHYGFAGPDRRGLGIAALFHGESGSGKTTAAEAVANALSLRLFRVDLSALISKYIGETAKNLRRVFDAAEGGGAVLLFDEADAIFTRRRDAKSDVEHQENINVGYLLSRIENFRGLVVLATNMKHALDPAFLRRLRFVIGFALPSATERKAIWSKVFPRSDTVGALDTDRLARFVLTGGQIYSAALAAAHAAAATGEGAKIEMTHVLDSIRWELHKVERPASESLFAERSVAARAPTPQAATVVAPPNELAAAMSAAPQETRDRA